MNQKHPQRRGLGRGLGALIPTAPPEGETDESGAGTTTLTASEGDHAAVGSGARSSAWAEASEPAAPAGGENAPAGVMGAYFAEVPVGKITPNRRQPRQVFDEEAMAELVFSIKEVGLLQPVVVRKTGDDSFELVMGERRWRASQVAGLELIPAIVRGTEDNDMLRDALLENLHRSQLNPLEEAAAYAQMLEDFGCTHEELANRIGRSRPQISNTLRLLKLSPAVQRRVAAGVLSAGHARSLLAIEDSDLQDRLAQRVVAEGISVRGLEEIVAVGERDKGGPRNPRRKPTAPGLTELAERLSDRFETRVKVDLGKSKGRISVEFASLDDLRRIVEIMDPRNREDRPI
jgi:ParB family chromosome partitioning protein